jgi:hypothetical protein
METIARGNTAETAVLDAFIERGFNVLIPFGGGHPYDLAVDLGPSGFLRRNNQRRGVRYAAQYELDRWTTEGLRGLAAGPGAMVATNAGATVADS